MDAGNSSSSRPMPWTLLPATVLLIVLILFNIDGGHYSVHDLLSLGNAITLGIFLAGLLGGLVVVNALSGRRLRTAGRMAVVIAVASCVGIAITILAFLFIERA